jgi:UDP-glucose-4-epimerase GalE
MENRTAFITGCAGYLGSHLSKTLVKSGWRVIGFDVRPVNHKYFNHYYTGDIRDRERVFEVLSDKRHKIDVVIHCASRIEVGESMKHPTEFNEVNVAGTAILLNAMKEYGIPMILFSSTAAVYETFEYPLREDGVTTYSNSVYGSSKMACEQMIRDSGISHGIFRYFNLTGADPEGDIGEDHNPETHLIPCILKNLNNFKIFGDDYDTPDGTCIRDYVHVSDVVDAHLLGFDFIRNTGYSFTLNLGSGQGYSVLDIIHKVKEELGLDVEYTVEGRRPGDPPKLVADITRAKQILSFEPKHDIVSILKTAHNWHENQKHLPKKN